MSMATLSHCRAAALPLPPAGRRRSDPPRFLGAPEPGHPAPPRRARWSEGALNLGLAALTIAGVAAFYGLLMLAASQIASGERRSPYADFYTAGQNPWSQTMVGAPAAGASLKLAGPTP
jgi:hypothetical protein